MGAAAAAATLAPARWVTSINSLSPFSKNGVGRKHVQHSRFVRFFHHHHPRRPAIQPRILTIERTFISYGYWMETDRKGWRNERKKEKKKENLLYHYCDISLRK